MALKALDVAQQIRELASLPDVCIKINELTDNPQTTTHDIKDVINTDPALAAKLLR